MRSASAASATSSRVAKLSQPSSTTSAPAEQIARRCPASIRTACAIDVDMRVDPRDRARRRHRPCRADIGGRRRSSGVAGSTDRPGRRRSGSAARSPPRRDTGSPASRSRPRRSTATRAAAAAPGRRRRSPSARYAGRSGRGRRRRASRPSEGQAGPIPGIAAGARGGRFAGAGHAAITSRRHIARPWGNRSPRARPAYAAGRADQDATRSTIDADTVCRRRWRCGAAPRLHFVADDRPRPRGVIAGTRTSGKRRQDRPVLRRYRGHGRRCCRLSQERQRDHPASPIIVPVEPNPPAAARGFVERVDLVQRRALNRRRGRAGRCGRRARSGTARRRDWRGSPSPRRDSRSSIVPGVLRQVMPCLSARPERGRTCTS